MARPEIPVRRSQGLAWTIVLPEFLLAVGMTIPVLLFSDDLVRNAVYTPVFFLMFSVAGSHLFRFEFRRQGIVVSLADLPLLLALYYLSPLMLLAAAVAGSIAAQVTKRADAVKGSFNIVSVAAGASCANLVVFSLGIDGSGPRTWGVLTLAVFVYSYSTLLSVAGVIMLVQGTAQIRQLWSSARFGHAVTAMNIVVGLIIILTMQANAWAAPLIVVLAGLLALGYRSSAQFARQHKTLTEMYDLTRALAATGQDGTLFDVLLARVGRVMRAESAVLWLPAHGRHPEVLLSARADYEGLLDAAITPEALRRHAVETGETVVVNARSGPLRFRAELDECGVKDAIVVPLRSGGVTMGTLEAAGRLGDRTLAFGADDVQLLETVAANAAVAIENSRLVDRLRFDASHDLLTSLPNRRRMLEALDMAIAAPVVDEVVAVLLFDVVDLRQVNSSLGQAAGDEVLIQVATRLRQICPAGAMLARIGGDEFVLEARIADIGAAVDMAESMRERLRERVTVGALAVDIDTSVGVAVHPDHGGSAELLLRRAEAAAHAAKRRTGIQVFNPALESRSVRRLGLAGDLREALDTEGLEVHFQPKVTISDRAVVGVECLVRWDHPMHGPVPPEDVVAVAEHTGDLSRLTDFVLRQGLELVRDMASSDRALPVSVNVAGRTLLDASFPDRVGSLLREYAVDPAFLTLEITEDATAADTERPLPTLHRLHDLGIRLSIDDFGMGYSSLAYLRRLPVQEIKVDRTFVQGMTTDPKDLSIVRTVVDLAGHFGLVAVAEGVESELTLSGLADMGCDIGQGFLFSRPLRRERLETWLGGQVCADGCVPTGEVRRLRAVP